MKKLPFLFALLLNSLSLLSQDFNDYQPLKNQGTLPVDFTVLPSVKYAKDLQKINDNDKRSVRKTQKKFYLNSNFAIDGLLKSGRVLFETEHATYLKDIIAILLKDKPETAKKIRVYLLRSPAVNAFATADGIVFVTLGLLAQVENEAQLAYILAHEIVHIDKKHALELVIQSDPNSKANDRQKLSRNGELSDKSLSRNLFTQDQELEADREGYKLFAKTDYAQKNINRVFDVLKYSELPFDNIAFERSFLETDYYKFPNYFFSETVKSIQGINENIDDSRSSHPNLFKRRLEITKILDNPKDDNKKEYVKEVNKALERQKDDAKKEYIISKDRFLKLQKVSRFEIAHLQLHKQLFQDAIYTAFLLNKTEKATQYPEVITAKALYGLAKFDNNDRITSTSEFIKMDSIEGESQQLYYLFYRMPTKDVVVFATSYVWRTYRKYPKNTDLRDMAYDLLWLVVHDYKLTEDDFEKTLAVAEVPIEVKPTPTPMVRDTTAVTKIDRIKLGETLTKLPEAASDWWKYTFIECLKDEDFTSVFKKMVTSFKSSNADNTKKENEKARENELAKARKEGHQLGVSKVVVVNPTYFKATESQKGWTSTVDVNLIDSERNVARFEKLMKENADIAGVDLVVLNPLELKKDDVQKLNDLTLLKEWYYEQSDAGSMPINGYRQKDIEALADKYNTDYFLWTGVIGVREKSSVGMKAAGAFTALTIIGIPLAVWMVTDSYEMYYYSILYNVKTGRNYIIKSEVFYKKDSNMLLNAHIYDTFLQIKSAKKGAENDIKTKSQTVKKKS